MPSAVFLILTLLAVSMSFVAVRVTGGMLDEIGRAALSNFAPDLAKLFARFVVRMLMRGVDPARATDLADEIQSIIDAEFESRKTTPERAGGIISVARQTVSLVVSARRIRSSETTLSVSTKRVVPSPYSRLYGHAAGEFFEALPLGAKRMFFDKLRASFEPTAQLVRHHIEIDIGAITIGGRITRTGSKPNAAIDFAIQAVFTTPGGIDIPYDDTSEGFFTPVTGEYQRPANSYLLCPGDHLKRAPQKATPESPGQRGVPRVKTLLTSSPTNARRRNS